MLNYLNKQKVKEMIGTRYVLEKENTELITYSVELVKQFLLRGWKFKHNELSQLI